MYAHTQHINSTHPSVLRQQDKPARYCTLELKILFCVFDLRLLGSKEKFRAKEKIHNNPNKRARARARTESHACMCVQTHTHPHPRTPTHTCIQIDRHTHMHTYAHTHTLPTRTHCQYGYHGPPSPSLFVSDGQIGLFTVGGLVIVPQHGVFLLEYIEVQDCADFASCVLHSLPRIHFTDRAIRYKLLKRRTTTTITKMYYRGKERLASQSSHQRAINQPKYQILGNFLLFIN